MVSTEIKGVKVVLKLAEGSQTISNCNVEATNEKLYALATAVGKLEAQRVDAITKVEETTLINE